MATITQDGNSFKIIGARRITANMTLFSPDATATLCTYDIAFSLEPARPPATSPNPTSLVSSLIRLVPGGVTQSTSIVVSAAVPKASPVTVPLGVFPGRLVRYWVEDLGNATKDRMVHVTIENLDGASANESWRHQVAAILPSGTRTDYVVVGPKFQVPATPMSVDGVDIIP
jgi:hypothetical protein